MRKILLLLIAFLMLAFPTFAQRSPLFSGKVQFFDRNGKPLASGRVYTYVAGTTTYKASYTSSTGGANTNPVILDSSGRADIWFDCTTSYKIILKDKNDVQQWSTDNLTDYGCTLYGGAATLAGDASGAYDAITVTALQGYDVSSTAPTANQQLEYISNAWTPTTTYLDATDTLDFGNTSAQTSADLTITVTGAAVGNTVSLALPASPASNSCFTAWVSAGDTVTVRFNNYSSGAIDPAPASFTVRVHQ